MSAWARELPVPTAYDKVVFRPATAEQPAHAIGFLLPHIFENLNEIPGLQRVEAALGGPIALIEDGDEIVVDLNRNVLDCTALEDAAIRTARQARWEAEVAANGGVHPLCGTADTRLLHRARHSAVPAVQGGGLHPDRQLWVRAPRAAERSGFVPTNRHRPDTRKAF